MTRNVTQFFKLFLPRLYLRTGRNLGSNLYKQLKTDKNNPDRYETAIECIKLALDHIESRYKKALKLRYFDNLKIIDVCNNLGVARGGSYYNLINKACNDFATEFYNQQLKHGFNKNDAIDLKTTYVHY